MKFALTIFILLIATHGHCQMCASPLTARFQSAQVTAGYSMTATEYCALTMLEFDLQGCNQGGTAFGNVIARIGAAWPMIASTSTTQKFNFINPDSSVITYVGSPSFSRGVTLNGTSMYANLNWAASAANATNLGFGSYQRTNTAGHGGIDMGASGSGAGGSYYYARYTDGKLYHENNSATETNVSNTTTSGLIINQRISSTQVKMYRAGAQIGTTQTNNYTSKSVLSFYIGAGNAGGSPSYSQVSTNHAFAICITDVLSDAEHATLNTAVVNFLTLLGNN